MTSINCCVICMETLLDEGNVQLGECGHTFHKKCFNQYVEHKIEDKTDIICPLCRIEIKYKFSKKQKMKKLWKKIKKEIAIIFKLPVMRMLIFSALVLVLISII